MSELKTIARPYAKATFRYAIANHSLEQWLAMLNALSIVAENSQVQAILKNPKISHDESGRFFNDVLSNVLDEHGKNFVKLLAEKGRLKALPAIFSLFFSMYEEHQKTVTATVTAASPLNEQQLESLKQALEKRLQHKIIIETTIDPTVYGGVRVQANDLVIDGTIKGRMQRLFENLNATR